MTTRPTRPAYERLIAAATARGFTVIEFDTRHYPNSSEVSLRFGAPGAARPQVGVTYVTGRDGRLRISLVDRSGDSRRYRTLAPLRELMNQYPALHRDGYETRRPRYTTGERAEFVHHYPKETF